jgi:hypothetical protein
MAVALVTIKPALLPMLADFTRRPKALRSLRVRAWWCMRSMPSFSVDSLLQTIATGSEHAARNNLVRYIAALEAAQVLQRLPALRRAAPARWTLANDLGLLAPVVCRGLNQISDPNSGALIDYITCEVPKC